MLSRITISAFLFLSMLSLVAQPPTIEAMEQARIHFNNGVKHGIIYDYESAITEFNKAVGLNPLFAEAFLYKGLAKIEMGQHEQALKDLTIAIELDPAYSDQAHYFRGVTKYQMGDYNGAIDDLTIAIRMNPDFVAYFQRGKANFELKEYKRSLQDFEIALRLNPDFYEAYLYRGMNLYYLEEYHEAVVDLEIAKTHLPGNAQVFYYSGLARTRIRNNYVAIEDLDRAIEINPAFSSAYEARAIAKVNTGDQESAQKDRELALHIQTAPPIQNESRTSELQTPRTLNELQTQDHSSQTSATDINFADLFRSQERKTESEVNTPSSALTPPVRSTDANQVSEVAEPVIQPSRRAQNIVNLAERSSGIYSSNLEETKPAGFGVQVASYSNTENLQKLAHAYQDRYAAPVFISVAVINNRKLYRLIIGQFPARKAAEDFRDQLKSDSFPDSFLVYFENLK